MVTAVLNVDVQRDFTVGALATDPTALIFENMNRLNTSEYIQIRIATGDKHYEGNKEFEIYGPHCLADKEGVKFDTRFNIQDMDLILYKGQDASNTGHSAFYDGAGKSTGLLGYLYAKSVDRLIITGFVTDICVLATVLDAMKHFDNVIVAFDACQAYDEMAVPDAIKAMEEAGARVMSTKDILEMLRND